MTLTLIRLGSNEEGSASGRHLSIEDYIIENEDEGSRSEAHDVG